MARSAINPSGILDNTVKAQEWDFFPNGALEQLYGGMVRGTRRPAPGTGGKGLARAGGGGAPAPSSGIDPMWARVQADADAANAANEARYAQLLGLADAGKTEELASLRGGYDAMLGLASKGFDGQRADEGKRLQNDLGGVQQSAVSRGLGNTTVLDSLQRGAQDDSARRMLSIDDQQTRQQLAVAQDYYGRLANATSGANNRKMGIIEGRTDEGPDLGLYASLLSRPGASGTPGSTMPFPIYPYGRGGSSTPQIFGGGWQRPAEAAARPQPNMTTPVAVGGGSTGPVGPGGANKIGGSPQNPFSYQTSMMPGQGRPISRRPTVVRAGGGARL
jgi:hypothetical protein